MSLPGTGPNGRIVESDLGSPTKRNAPLSEMRRAIAQRTTESFSIPQFHLRAEIDASELLKYRESRLREIEAASGVRITLTDLFLKAMGVALKKSPQANSVWRGDSIEALSDAHVGLVVSLSDGLLMPVVRGVDALDLQALAGHRRDLVEAARSGKLSPESTRGAAASLSNLGNSQVDEFSAILAAGQTTMLAIGRIAPRPWVVNGEVIARPTVKLCLTVDHRALDGDPAAKFLGQIIEGLENPAQLF